MKKSVSKRIRVTRNKKIVRRSTDVNHFRTRKSTKNIRHKKQPRSIDYPIKKIIGY